MDTVDPFLKSVTDRRITAVRHGLCVQLAWAWRMETLQGKNQDLLCAQLRGGSEQRDGEGGDIAESNLDVPQIGNLASQVSLRLWRLVRVGDPDSLDAHA